MKLTLLNPTQKLKASLQKQNLKREDIELFKTNIKATFTHITEAEKRKETEENFKAYVRDFLLETNYKGKYAINTKERKDLVIHNQSDYNSSVGVIIEAKKPSNKSEMISLKNINCKSFQQLVYYYFTERISGNKDIKHLVITNIYDWYIFDAKDFEILFYDNKKLRKEFDEFKSKSTIKSDTDWFYTEIAKPFIEELEDKIPCTHFNLKDYEQVIFNDNQEDDEALLDLYKILSPEHLLKKQIANDSNSLNNQFYKELLHIVGIEEIKDGSKKVIQRCKVPNDGSLLENTLNKLRKEFREITDTEEQYSIALELCITWLNRILFLKLLEGQLIKYNQSTDFSFLNYNKIKDYDELEELFFEVLAENYNDRSKTVNEQFGNIPYLNSSLFEKTDLEKKYFGVNVLKDRLDLPIYSQTILNNLAKGSSKKTLEYLFEFLEAYDFGDDSKGKIKEQSKSIINASVLGLIFEKINGYKDGSFFTPGFITMYMCRESIRRAVVQKFNDTYSWECADFTDLYNRIDKVKLSDANELINSLKICDPAVGSGHFLVSALNEIISIKSDLEILADKDYKRLKGYKIEIDNDELIIKDEEGKLYDYNPKNVESRRIQETLFNEKQTIIENCLFGVDINPKSVMICRLRLWIELLKNAYYTESSKYEHLETLPNIDINIKCGNSLISRFGLDTDVSQMLKKSKWNIDAYQIAVERYKNAETKDEKREMEQLISTIKQEFRSEISLNDPLYLKLRKLNGELFSMTNQGQLFTMTDEEKKTWNQKLEKLHTESSKLETQIEEIKSNKIYDNSFEWRFEFPEVLDDNGNFLGFDVIIGNPPYLRPRNNENEKSYYSRYTVFENQYDLFHLFIELSNKISKSSNISLIVPNTFLANENTKKLRKYILDNLKIDKVIDSRQKVFEDADVDVLMLIAGDDSNKYYELINGDIVFKHQFNTSQFSLNDNYNFSITLNSETEKILSKINAKRVKAEALLDICSGIKEYQVGKGTPPQIQSDKDNRIYNSNSKIDESYVKELRGKNIDSFIIKWNSEYVKYGKHLAEPRDEKYFSGEKILLRQIPGKNKLIVSYTDETYIIDQTLYIGKSINKDVNIKFILGCLNSKITFWYFKNINNEFDNLFPKIKVNEFRSLPIPICEFSIQKSIINLVDKILSQKQKDPKADTFGLEAEIDRLVYEVYGLSEEEVNIIEKK